LSRRRLPFASRENQEVVGFTLPFPVAIPARSPRRPFLPEVPSNAPPSGWPSPQFVSARLPVSLRSRFLAPPWIRGQDPRVLPSKLINLQADRFIAKSLGYWSLSVAPPTRLCQFYLGAGGASPPLGLVALICNFACPVGKPGLLSPL